MSLDVHTVTQSKGSTGFLRLDRVTIGALAALAYAAGNGTVTAIAAGTPGAGYATIPTVALVVPGSGAKHTGSGATATAVMGVQTASVNAGGTGGTPGAVTITGTTGTGTKFQATGTINGSGVLTGPLVVTVAGAYTAMPSSLTAEVITGGSLSGCTITLSMGVVSYTVGSAGTHYPVGFATATVSGGTPVTPAVPGGVTVTSAAGDISVTDITNLSLPTTFLVEVSLDQDATYYITNRTNVGFTITISPRLAANTLAAGVADVLIVH